MSLLKDRPRHRTLLQAVADLAAVGGRGPFQAADGTRRARGVSMASPFGSETATIAEVSLKDGEARVHDLWIAIDPGSVVNPAIVKRQVESAAALGLSSTLLEQVVYEGGQRQARNFDAYPILDRERMPRVHVAIVESGRRWAASASRVCPACPRQSSMPLPRSPASACAACRSPRPACQAPDRRRGRTCKDFSNVSGDGHGIRIDRRRHADLL